MAGIVIGHSGLTRRLWLSGAAWKTSGIVLLEMLLGSCGRSTREPVTLTYPHGWWSEPDELSKWTALSRQFTRETGVHVREVPTPESTLDGLDLLLRLLQMGSSGADLLHVDLIYSAILEPDLIDLQPYSVAELSSIEPELMPSYTVGGKIVAIPYQVNVGALEYRTDLLYEYGYDHPPKTWDDLETMAERIQAGERAKGKNDFWGYVWQGAAAEALTCNALEWQIAEGGGRIIETDRTVSVNNHAAIRAWQRGRRWIGRISPPSVVAYQERDSMNVFDSGGAAFNRVWLGTTIVRGERSRRIYWRSSPPLMKSGFSTIPGGAGGSAATLGGYGLAVSLHSIHRQEAVNYLRFLSRAQIQSNKSFEDHAKVRPLLSLSSPDNYADQSIQRLSPLVSRPSIEVGRQYRQVSHAYAAAVHSVLTGEKNASAATAELEQQLIKMTGFRTGPPKVAA